MWACCIITMEPGYDNGGIVAGYKSPLEHYFLECVCYIRVLVVYRKGI